MIYIQNNKKILKKLTIKILKIHTRTDFLI